jgi:hypothetical protein
VDLTIEGLEVDDAQAFSSAPMVGMEDIQRAISLLAQGKPKGAVARLADAIHAIAREHSLNAYVTL